MIKQYIQIIKPRIVFGNLISVIGGFLLAAKGNVDYTLLLITIAGISLIMSSSCIYNNLIDCDIDRKMERTKNRAIAKGFIPIKSALVYATLLGISGFTLLFFKTNLITVWISVIGFIVYIGIYSLFMKRRSIYSTLIGSVAGAVPPVAGYCSVTNRFDLCALILLIIFILWQIPHFYAIVIYRLKDYKAANIPVFPLEKGISISKNHIIFYILAFAISTLVLFLTGYTGYKYLLTTVTTNLLWIIMAFFGYKTTNNQKWAHKLYICSIFTISTLSIMMSIDFIHIS